MELRKEHLEFEKIIESIPRHRAPEVVAIDPELRLEFRKNAEKFNLLLLLAVSIIKDLR